MLGTRSKKLKKNSIIVLVCQLLNLLVSFILVPITLRMLGVTNYGIWITLIGIIEWFTFFDIGFGHGFRNKYAEAKVREDYVSINHYVSTVFFMLVFISVSIFIIFGIACFFLDWHIILNAPINLQKELGTLAFILCTTFCIRFIVNLIFILLLADQSPYIQYIVILSGGVFSLLSLKILEEINSTNSMLTVGITISVSQLSPIVIAFIYLFATKYKSIIPKFRNFSLVFLKSIFSLGLNFFLIQLTALLLYYTNYILISHIAGPSQVTEYSISYKYINVLYVMFMAILTPVWSSFTEAYVKKEIDWIRNTIKKINMLWILTCLGGILLIILSPIIYKLWVKKSITPDYYLLIMLLIYSVFTIRFTIYRTFMNGVSKIKLQFYVTFIEALAHVPLCMLLGKFYGIYGVVFVMALWAVINSIWEPIQYKKIITGDANGIWNK